MTGEMSPPGAPDLNGNTSKRIKKHKNQIITNDGRVFYPCQYCNKVFPIKKTRTTHIKKCPAKDYILSVGEVCEDSKKISIQQNIVINEEKKEPPIKLTLRRSPSNGKEVSNHFTVCNSLVLKENDFNTIAKRLETNAVTITKQAPKKEEKESEDLNELTCRECKNEFTSSIELLRHSRKCHSYPKVMMALSEVKKFYCMKDRSECPICHKPLKINFRSAFVKHLHTHTNEMAHACKVCNKKFRRADHMKAHEKRHIVKDKK